MKSLRAASVRTWQRRFVLCTTLFALAAPLVAAPKKRNSRGSGGPRSSAPAVAHATPAAPELADVYASSSPATPDLRLVQEGERKADALANFATGLIADDNADSELALQKYRRALELDP